MVAPTPSLTFGVDLGDLPKDVHEIKNAIGTQPPGTTIFDSLQATNNQLGKVDFNDLANNAKAAATSSKAAETQGNSLVNSIGLPKSGPSIANVIDAMNASIGASGTTGSIADNVQAITNRIGSVDFNNVASNAGAAATNAGAAASSANAARDAIIGTPTSPGITDAILGNPTAPGIRDAIIGTPTSPGIKDAIFGTSTAPGIAANVQSTWQKLEDVDFVALATKADITTLQEEICKLRSLVCHCWWQDVCWVYLDRDATDSSAVKVFDQVGFRDETRRAQITADNFKRACEQHQMQDFLPADLNKLLDQLRKFTAKPSARRPARR
jgi:hypothetical protein